MSDLGQLLRKARTERGITLDELQESTKIRKRYLEAIEEGKFDVLPGNFYVRAFVKQYSEAVGLDPDEVFRLYAHVIPSPDTEASTEPIRLARRTTVNPPDRIGKWASAFLMIAFPVLIIGVVYYYVFMNMEPRGEVLPNETITDSASSDGSELGAQDPPSEPSLPEQQPEPAIEPEPAPEPNVTFVEKFRVNKNEIERFEVRHAEQISIELSVIGTEAWVGVTDAAAKSKYLHQGRMVQNDSYKADFAHNIYLNIGRANAVQLKVNGVAVDMGTEPNPRKFQFELAKLGAELKPTE